MTNDYSKTHAALERIVQNVLDKFGLLRTEHEVGVVVERQDEENRVLVQSLVDDSPPQYVTTMAADQKHLVGDKVLMQYLNRDINNRIIIGTMSRGYEEEIEEIDYSDLPVTPMRLYRGGITHLPPSDCGGSHKNIGDSEGCPAVPRVEKIVYGEGKKLEWYETYQRNGQGRIISITTVLPPNESVKITNYIHRDQSGFMDYYGPGSSGQVIIP